MTVTGAMLSRAEIAAAVGVRRQVVDNWARRRPDFPPPVSAGGRRCYSVPALLTWLDLQPVPSNVRHDNEAAGVTYGERFRRSFPQAPEPVSADVGTRADGPAGRSDDVLDWSLWQPLQRYRRTAGRGAYDELVLVMVYLAAEDPYLWARLVAARRASAGALLNDTLRAHASVRPGLAEILRGLAPKIWPDEDLAEVIETVARAVRPGVGVETAAATVFKFLHERFEREQPTRDDGSFTPPTLVDLMVDLAAPKPGDMTGDPCCGTGELLVAAAARAGRSPDAAGPRVYGSAPDERSRLLTFLNAAVHGLQPCLDLHRDSPLRQPSVPASRHDVIVMNPPFNHRPWTDGDPSMQGRWPYGPPPRNNANFAWLQHVVSALSDGGRAAVVMPNGASASADEKERAIRAGLVERGAVRCILALPPQLFPHTPIPATVWILEKPHGAVRGEVLFINAGSRGVMADRTHRVLADRDRERIAEAYWEWRDAKPGTYHDTPGLASAVPREQIKNHGYRLNPDTYVPPAAAASRPGARQVTAEVRELRRHLAKLRARSVKVDAAVERQLRRLGQ